MSFSTDGRYAAAQGLTFDLGQIRDMLGSTLERRALVRHLQALVDQRGFPPPLPAPRWGSGPAIDLTDRVTARSVWMAGAVVAWFDHFLPPSASANAAAQAAAAADMDAAARNLGNLRLIKGGRA